MLTLTRATLATVDELFQYKYTGLPLEEFPGYTPDQWGIKAHNRPWIDHAGAFAAGQKVIEVGGAYSTLPKYLAEKYDLEAWVGDDFGKHSGEESSWTRWGDPLDLQTKNNAVKYIFQPFGVFSHEYPDGYFDRIFSVSTLEHIPYEHRLKVFQDMNRCMRPGGMQLHTIDITIYPPKHTLMVAMLDKLLNTVPFLSNPLLRALAIKGTIDKFLAIRGWFDIIRRSGVQIGVGIPNSIHLLNRRTLVDSPDVVYRFYPPNNKPKRYRTAASLLVIIEDR
jgi:SAM-dependent methyltransferase